MNTTGLVTLIALNVGLDRRLIGPQVFSMMVLMALITTLLTSPIFNRLFYIPSVKTRAAALVQAHALEQGGSGGEASNNSGYSFKPRALQLALETPFDTNQSDIQVKPSPAVAVELPSSEAVELELVQVGDSDSDVYSNKVD